MLCRMALIVNTGLAIALAATWVRLAEQGAFWRADFTSYYTAWSMILDDRGDHLYDRDLQTQYQQRIVPQRGSLLPFNNPPHATIPAALFALLPLRTAFYVWDLAQLLLLVPLLYFLHRLTPDRRPLPFAVLVSAVLAFPPLFQSFQLGQLSLFVLVCLLGFSWNLTQNRPFGTALWLTLGTIKPQLMVAPVVILIAGRRWRELGWTAGLFTAWALLTTSILGVSCWLDFAAMLRHSARQFGSDGIYPLAMYNLKGCLTSLLGVERAGLINLLSTAALLLAMAAIGWLWRGNWRTDTPGFDLRLALTLQLALLVNPHFNPADVVTLLAPALLFYRGVYRAGWPVRALVVVLACSPLLFALDCYGISSARPSAPHLFFLVMAGLGVCMIAGMTRSTHPASGVA